MASKKELLDFLDKYVFHRILNTNEEHFATKQREDLHDLKRFTEEEKARYHGYDTAERIVTTYKEDASAEKYKPINARLQDLGLPRLVDVRDEFLRIAGE